MVSKTNLVVITRILHTHALYSLDELIIAHDGQSSPLFGDVYKEKNQLYRGTIQK